MGSGIGSAAAVQIGNALSATDKWVKAPFIGSASPLGLFLATGLVMVFIILWTRILGHLSSLGV